MSVAASSVGLLVHGEGLGGPPGRVQGPHRLPVQPLAQRPAGRQRPQLRHRFRAAAERQVRLDPVLYGGQPQVFEARRLGLGVREVGQRGATPQGEGLAEPGRGGQVVAGGEGGPPGRGPGFELVCVHGVGGDRDPVPRSRWPRPPRAGRPTAQPRDL
ncbi:hypothetical protein SAMN05216533_2521 [Streptomyces sp. Ag109_O5-10]|nr:hypothetical protein SAMN05216533_2521 [Streptomyces sp. Ag109_O5-10]